MLPTHVHHCYNIYLTSPSHQSMETGNGIFKWAINHRIYFISQYSCQFEEERYSSSGFVYSCPPLPTLPWARLTSHGSLLALDAMISGYTHLSNSRIQSLWMQIYLQKMRTTSDLRCEMVRGCSIFLQHDYKIVQRELAWMWRLVNSGFKLLVVTGHWPQLFPFKFEHMGTVHRTPQA